MNEAGKMLCEWADHHRKAWHWKVFLWNSRNRDPRTNLNGESVGGPVVVGVKSLEEGKVVWNGTASDG